MKREEEGGEEAEKQNLDQTEGKKTSRVKGREEEDEKEEAKARATGDDGGARRKKSGMRLIRSPPFHTANELLLPQWQIERNPKMSNCTVSN